MRTPAQAARDAVSGKDETLWQRCWDDIKEHAPPGTPPWPLSMSEAERIIGSFSSAELKLYDISSEAEK